MEISISAKFNKVDLLVDGKKFNNVLAYTYPENLQDFTVAGIKAFRFSLPIGWVGPDQYDYTATDSVIDEILAKEPDAKLFPLIWFSGPEIKWFELAYPEEVMAPRSVHTDELLFDDLVGAGRFARNEPDMVNKVVTAQESHHSTSCFHSFASDIWLKGAKKALTCLFEHLENTYGDRFLGYYVCGGGSYEWINWTSYTLEVMSDYSSPFKNHFESWLKNKYRTDDALRAAWGDPTISLTTAALPLPSRRTVQKEQSFYQLPQQQAMIDIDQALSDRMAHNILELCSTAKKSSRFRPLIGVFYGYWWTMSEATSAQRKGHLALEQVLGSPQVDFIAGPFDYTNRDVGGVHSAQSLPGAARLNGKLYIDSCDIKSFIFPGKREWFSYVKPAKDEHETENLFKREFAHAFAENIIISWVDLLGGTFSHPAMAEGLRKIQNIAAENTDIDRSSSDEFIVVFDGESLMRQIPNSHVSYPLISVQKQWNLMRCGAPFTQVSMTDFIAGKCPKAKFVYFINPFYMTPDRITSVHTQLAKTNATAIWPYAPGFLTESGISEEQMKALTGFPIKRYKHNAGDLAFKTIDSPDLAEIPGGFEYGTAVHRDAYTANSQYYPAADRMEVDPLFTFEPDGDIEVLATWQEDGAAALGITKTNGFTSIFSASPLLPPEILRPFLASAGVHIFSDAGDVVYAAGQFLAIYTGPEPSRTVKLPKPGKVYDLCQDQYLTDGPVTSFNLVSQPNETWLLRIEPSRNH